jgi:hypothetical protein
MNCLRCKHPLEGHADDGCQMPYHDGPFGICTCHLSKSGVEADILRERVRILQEALKVISNATNSDCDGEKWMKRIARSALDATKEGK